MKKLLLLGIISTIALTACKASPIQEQVIKEDVQVRSYTELTIADIGSEVLGTGIIVNVNTDNSRWFKTQIYVMDTNGLIAPIDVGSESEIAKFKVGDKIEFIGTLDEVANQNVISELSYINIVSSGNAYLDKLQIHEVNAGDEASLEQMYNIVDGTNAAFQNKAIKLNSVLNIPSISTSYIQLASREGSSTLGFSASQLDTTVKGKELTTHCKAAKISSNYDNVCASISLDLAFVGRATSTWIAFTINDETEVSFNWEAAE